MNKTKLPETYSQISKYYSNESLLFFIFCKPKTAVINKIIKFNLVAYFLLTRSLNLNIDDG